MVDCLKLRAVDEEDLEIISACLQDAVIAVGDMRHSPEKKRFHLAGSRFRWENCEESKADCDCYERVSCGVTFEKVRAVKTRGLDLGDRERMLDLLAIQVDDGAVDLLFAGGPVVRLEVERLLCHMRDMGEPWPTQWRPHHRAADGA